MKKVLCCLLALLTLSILLASCGNAGTGDTTTAPAAQTSGEGDASTVPEETGYQPPEVADLTGYDYRMLVIGNSLWVPLYYSETASETGDVMNDALYRREIKLEEMYKCNIEVIVDAQAQTTLSNYVSTGTDLCEAVFITGVNSIAAAKSGYLVDIAQTDGFRLDCPWWDQRIQEEYRIGSHLFTLEGDISVREDLRTMTVVYNKKLYTDFDYVTKYGKPYDMVSNGEWTYERLCEMIKEKSVSTNGDSVLDANDFWGMLSEVSAPYYFFLGSGMKTVTNDKGEISLHINDESVYNFMEKTIQMTINPDIMIVNSGKYTTSFGGTDQWTKATQMFLNDQCLFRSTTLSAVNGLRNMTSDYGLLPVPNAGGGSTEYYCYVSGSSHTPLTMPSNVKELDKAVLMTEAMAYYSSYSTNNSSCLRDAFYEELATARLARAVEDKNMLEIIFASKTYDIDQTATLTGLESAIYSIAKAGNVTALSSTFTSYGKVANRAVTTFMEAIEKNNQ